MLVLSRKSNEKVIIEIPEGVPRNTKIEVVLVNSDNRRAKIGFVAPKTVSIFREELLIRNNKKD